MDGPWNDFAPAAKGPWSDFAPSVGVGEDIAKTAVPSLERMATETLGTGGDVRSLLSAGATKLGIPDRLQTAIGQQLGRTFPPAAAIMTAPTTAQIQEATGTDKLYQPQTPAGKLFDTSVRFAPSVIGGPENLAVKAGTRVLAPA